MIDYNKILKNATTKASEVSAEFARKTSFDTPMGYMIMKEGRFVSLNNYSDIDTANEEAEKVGGFVVEIRATKESANADSTVRDMSPKSTEVVETKVEDKKETTEDVTPEAPQSDMTTSDVCPKCGKSPCECEGHAGFSGERKLGKELVKDLIIEFNGKKVKLGEVSISPNNGKVESMAKDKHGKEVPVILEPNDSFEIFAKFSDEDTKSTEEPKDKKEIPEGDTTPVAPQSSEEVVPKPVKDDKKSEPTDTTPTAPQSEVAPTDEDAELLADLDDIKESKMVKKEGASETQTKTEYDVFDEEV